MNAATTSANACPHGGYQEQDTIIHAGVWADLASRCWNSPSAWRMGIEAEKYGVRGNPYKGVLCRDLFEAGRVHMQAILKNESPKNGA